MKVKVFNMENVDVGSLDLNDNVFGLEYNEPLIHEVVVAYNTNNRQGTKCTLTRSEVRGHAKKPWKQKHTGRARHGSTKGPQWTGGGVVFAPKPRSFSKKVNKFAKRTAFLSALSQKIRQNEVTILDEFKLANPKTREVVNFLEKFGFDKSVLFVLAENNNDAKRAINNLSQVNVEVVDILNTYDIVANKQLVFTKAAVKSIEEAYAE